MLWDIGEAEIDALMRGHVEQRSAVEMDRVAT